MALGYYALGPGARDVAHSYLTDYYGFIGPYAEQVAQGALVDADGVRDALAAFAAEGCDELILFPCSPEPDQVDRLMEIVAS